MEKINIYWETIDYILDLNEKIKNNQIEHQIVKTQHNTWLVFPLHETVAVAWPTLDGSLTGIPPQPEVHFKFHLDIHNAIKGLCPLVKDRKVLVPLRGMVHDSNR